MHPGDRTQSPFPVGRGIFLFHPWESEASSGIRAALDSGRPAAQPLLRQANVRSWTARPSEGVTSMPLPHRPLGKTGVQVPIIGYGTAPLGKIKVMDAPMLRKSEALLNHAIDSGITYLDTSPDYGSQPKLGPVLKTRRDEVFLATKINKRRRDDVLKELQENLKELQTDHVDLIQIHAVNAMADLEAALAPDGTIPALEEARRQ